MAAWLVCVSLTSLYPNILTEFPEQKCRTYMSIVEEPVFAGNFVRCRLASRYVDCPRVGVDLLSQHRFQPRHQQDQQRRECELQQPEPAAYRGRARSHGVFLVQHGLWAQYRGARRRTENGHGHGSPGEKNVGERRRRTQDAIMTHPHMENLKAGPERKSCVSLCDSLWPLRCNKQKTVHTWAYVPQANCSHKANRNFFRILQWTIEGE